MRDGGAFHFHRVRAGLTDHLLDLLRIIDEIVAGGDDADDMVNVRVVQRLVGQFEQTVVAMVFLDGPVGGAGLEFGPLIACRCRDSAGCRRAPRR